MIHWKGSSILCSQHCYVLDVVCWYLIDPEIAASITSMQRCEMWTAAHLSSLKRVLSLRPLVAIPSTARRLSRNVRISRTLMPYHHKAPQHERTRRAGLILSSVAHVGRRRRRSRGWSLAPRGTTDWLAACSRRRARRRRTQARSRRSFPSPTLIPISLRTT